MADDLIIRGGRPNGGVIADMSVRGGRIAAIGADLAAPTGAEIVDAGGCLVLPGMVDAHTHLDKSLWGMEWRRNETGPTLQEKIDHERRVKKDWDIDPVRQSRRQVELSAIAGTSHILSHLDIDTENGLWPVEGVMETREACRGLMDIQLVAFPQSGLMRRPGTLELMDAALGMGVEWVGGIDPYLMDRDPKGHLDAIFGLAQKHGRPIDIHLHEPEEMGALTLDLVFERVRALGMQGRLTISHAFCLGSARADIVEPLIAKLAEHDVAIMSTGPSGWPAPPVKGLVQAGVRVSSGNDGMRDTWKPYGNADMLERAMHLGLRNRFSRDDEVELAFDICSRGGAAVMGVTDHGLKVGAAADFFLVEALNVTHAVVAHPPRRLVVKGGRIVARDGQLVDAA